ncbi:hypothetical protein SAY86_016050 [Trapa natans]|uniref:Calcium uniporter protein C-terminal domain-containing protein n=1 Tax=Trapa natans TaxID=22666 RepID=A0AAN7L5S0_TRANT|nr:hypothetical protein SAY86_016050 [Trapa natans]
MVLLKLSTLTSLPLRSVIFSYLINGPLQNSITAFAELPTSSSTPPTAVSIVASTPLVADPAHPPLRREYFTSPETPEGGILRRFFQRRSLTQAAAGVLPDFLSFPVGDRLRERLRSIGTPGHRLRLDGLSPPTHASVVPQDGLSVVEARKLLKLACMERLKSKLRAISESSITYEQYLKICNQACENEDHAVELAKTMDEIGNVIVLGNIGQSRRVISVNANNSWPTGFVAKSMEAILHQTIVMHDDPRRVELGSMEEEKSEIDSKARAQVRAELYCGLGFIVMQTLGFMRLTFWELSWDVMEPICFFVTSLHFTLAYP